jgi:AcrR family transcriptional regulator
VLSRRRGTQLEEAILQAAWDEVSEVGYAGFTMEAVATRAATSKPVLYRRWPTRAALILAAMQRQVVSISSEIPDTGNLRDDVLSLLRQLRRRYREVGPDVIHGLMTERHEVPASVFQRVPDVMMTILRRASERGEVRLAKVTPRIASLPGDLLRHQLLIAREPASDVFLAEVVDEILLPLVGLRTGPER